MSTIAIAALIGVPLAAGFGLAAIWLTRERALSPEDAATVAEWEAMHAEDTGGLMLPLPAPGTTVKIPPADRRAAARTIVHHEAPTRGDAQGRAGGCAPAPRDASLCRDSRPAPGADLTGSLSPRPTQERPGPVSAPPDPGAPDVPGRDSAESAGVATAMDAPQPRPAGDPATMSGPDYLAWVTERSEWDHETSWFSAIEVEA